MNVPFTITAAGAALMLLCVSGPPGGAAARMGDESSTVQLLEDVFQWQLKEWPLFATSIGVHTYDHTLTNYTLQDFMRRKEEAQAFLNRCNDLVSHTEDPMSINILRSSLQAFVDGHQYVMFGALNPITRLQGLQRDYTSWLPLMRRDTADHYDILILRYRALVTAIGQHIDLMKKAIEVGRTNNLHSMDGVLDQLDAVILQSHSAEDIQKSPFYVPFNRTEPPEDADQWDWNILHTDGQNVIVDISEAFKRMRDFLEYEYLPEARVSEGVMGWPQGAEYYSACLRWHLSLELSAEEIHDTGLREVARIEQRMLAVIRRIEPSFTGTVRDFFDSLAGNTQFYGKTAEWLLSEYKYQITDVIAPKLPTMFSHIPEYDIQVKPMPQDTSGGSYTAPPEDGSRPGTFNVNLFNPQDKPTFGMMALTLHEASPGHHFQITTAMDQQMPMFRRKRLYAPYNNIPMSIPTFTSYTEGWALYAEMLGEEMEAYRDEYELLGRYSSEMFRATRLVIDTGIHAKGWSYDEGYEYMRRYTSRPDGLIANEIKRYISWPGQACAYKIGEIRIAELRTEAMQRLGSAFHIKEFHERVLSAGAVPLTVLDTIVTDYIEDRLQQQENTAARASNPSRYAAALALCAILLKVLG